MKQQKGYLTIGQERVSDDTFGHISIDLRNEDIKVEFQIDISFENFAKCITGFGHIPCTYKKFGGGDGKK